VATRRQGRRRTELAGQSATFDGQGRFTDVAPLPAMQRRNERKAITLHNPVSQRVLKLPVHVVDQHEHSWPDCAAKDKHVVALADKVQPHPLDEVAQRRNLRGNADVHVLAVVEQMLETAPARGSRCVSKNAAGSAREGRTGHMQGHVPEL
jgi:hypothetical protein